MATTKMDLTKINMTRLYISNQKMLYNIMVSNRILCEAVGVSKDKLDGVLFNLDPIVDLGK